MKEIINAIRRIKSAVILPHISIDGDCLGSAEAMHQLLLRLGISSFICLDKEPPSNLSFICKDYVIYKEGIEYPSFDECICVDCGDIGRLGDRKALFDRASVTLCIDHHITNQGFAMVNYIDGDASSTGEIISRLYLSLKEPFGESATSLYSAIFTDTGGFRFSNTSPQTMRLAADLIEAGANPAEISTRVYDTEPIEKLRLTAKAIDSIELYYEGRLAIIALTMDDIISLGATEADTDGFSSLARSIKGVEIGAFIKPSDSGYKVSLRSKETADVAAIAQSFGGGGHIRASGYTFSGSLEDAKKALLEKVVF